MPTLPVLHARVPGPLDALVEVARLPEGERVEEAGGAARAPGVDPDARVTIGHPLLRVDDLPVGELVAGPLGDVGVRGDHHPPLVRVTLLERQALGVGAVGEDHRVPRGPVRAEHVGPEHDAVVHRDGHVPLDHHVRAPGRSGGPGRLIAGRGDV